MKIPGNFNEKVVTCLTAIYSNTIDKTRKYKFIFCLGLLVCIENYHIFLQGRKCELNHMVVNNLTAIL